MTHAREPKREELVAQVMDEIKADNKIIAAAMFGGDSFKGSHVVAEPDFLSYVREAWAHGVQTDTEFLTPGEWRARLLERHGPERFWEIAHKAWQLPKSPVGPEPELSFEERVEREAAEMAEGGDDAGLE